MMATVKTQWQPTMQDYLIRKAMLDQRSNSESGGGVSAADYDALDRLYEAATRNVSRGVYDNSELPPVKKPTTPVVKPVEKPVDKPPAKTKEQLEEERLGRVGKARTWWDTQMEDIIGDAFESENVNTADFQSYIDEALKEAYGGITGAGKFEKTSQYAPFVNKDLGDTILNNIRTDKQKDFSDELNSTYSSTFVNDTFADTMDDEILNSILTPQYDDSVAAITRAFNRGTLSQGGFDAAMNDLNSQKTAGMSTLQTTGGGVLGGYRDDTQELIDQGLTSAGSWDFGGNWTPKNTTDLVSSTITDLTGRLEGDIRKAVGDQQYFDWSDLIQKGGTAQGLYNPATSGDGSGSLLFGAIKDRSDREKSERGLGTQGVF